MPICQCIQLVHLYRLPACNLLLPYVFVCNTGRSSMAHVEKVFISYRREDATDIAGRIRDWLIKSWHLAKDKVFMDVTGVPAGADFMQFIDQTIAQCQAMIIVISPSWLARVNDPGTSYVRLEAEAALRHHLRIIPILVGNTQQPRAEHLPPSLRELTRLNIRPLRPDAFEYDMDWVRKGLGIRTGLG